MYYLNFLDIFNNASKGVATIPANDAGIAFEVHINENAFLKVGAEFRVSLLEAVLAGKVILRPKKKN